MTETTVPQQTNDPYAEIAGRALVEAKAKGVLLVVLGGEHGDGFTLKERKEAGVKPGTIGLVFVRILRAVADQIELRILRATVAGSSKPPPASPSA